MAQLIVLGTSNAIPDEAHENTHMALVGSDGVVLIDCVSTPKVRLARAGIELDAITDLILTHFHPDHVSGVPLLLMNMWLMGRQRPLRIYGLHHCLARVEDMMGFYHWENWPDFFPVSFHRLPERERVLVLEKSEFRVFSSPVRHLVPTIGLRMEASNGDRAWPIHATASRHRPSCGWPAGPPSCSTNHREAARATPRRRRLAPSHARRRSAG
jgi:ribonuclease Z